MRIPYSLFKEAPGSTFDDKWCSLYGKVRSHLWILLGALVILMLTRARPMASENKMTIAIGRSKKAGNSMKDGMVDGKGADGHGNPFPAKHISPESAPKGGAAFGSQEG